MGLLKDLFAKTPKKGKVLTKIGLGIGAVGLGLEFDVLPLENMLTNEKYIFWLLVVKYACMSIGTFLTGAGLVQKEETPPKTEL